MLNITVRTNAADLTAALNEVQRKQIPFATAQTLTELARMSQRGVVQFMESKLDAPTPWTLRGTYVLAARKKDFPMQARFWLRDFAPKGSPATKYLGQHIYSGTRNTKRSELALQRRGIMKPNTEWAPAPRAKTDRYGNLRGPQITKMLSQLQANTDPMQNTTSNSAKRKNNRGVQYYVVHNKRGEALGINIRRGKAIERFMVFTKGRSYYRKRIPFFQIVENVSRANYDRVFSERLDYALATAKTWGQQRSLL